MATTNADISATVLDCLLEAGVEYAVLHGAEEVASGTVVSDVDLVAGVDPALAMDRASPHLAAKGLTTIMIWTYDIGSASVFVVDGTARDGAQLDIVSDRSGLGAYGIVADGILSDATRETRWPKASSSHELLYLILKRRIKGQEDRVEGLRAVASTQPEASIRESAHRGFSAPAAARMLTIIDGRDLSAPRTWRARRSIAQAQRLGVRLVRPVGRWIATNSPDGEAVCGIIVDRLGRVLPNAQSRRMTGGPAHSPKEIRQVTSSRLRAGVLASWGDQPKLLQPDITLDAAQCVDTERMLRHVVAEMGRLRGS